MIRKAEVRNDFSFTGKYVCVHTFEHLLAVDIILQAVRELGQNGTFWRQNCHTETENGMLSFSPLYWE